MRKKVFSVGTSISSLDRVSCGWNGCELIVASSLSSKHGLLMHALPLEIFHKWHIGFNVLDAEEYYASFQQDTITPFRTLREKDSIQLALYYTLNTLLA